MCYCAQSQFKHTGSDSDHIITRLRVVDCVYSPYQGDLQAILIQIINYHPLVIAKFEEQLTSQAFQLLDSENVQHCFLRNNLR